MIRGVSVFLGIGLVFLWIAGMSGPFAPAWMAWLDLLAAISAFVIAGVINPSDKRARRAGAPLLLSAGLFAVWLIGLTSPNITSWMTWWNFTFACAFLLLGITSASRKEVVRHPSQITKTIEGRHEDRKKRDRFRKSA